MKRQTETTFAHLTRLDSTRLEDSTPTNFSSAASSTNLLNGDQHQCDQELRLKTSGMSLHAMAPSGSSSGLLNEREVVRRAGRDAISQFLDGHTCFSVLRASGKVVVFDTRIPIQLAFYALVEHGEFNVHPGNALVSQDMSRF